MLPIVLENIARRFGKRCPWFFKTLPMVLQNIARDFFEPRAMFLGVSSIGEKSPFLLRRNDW